MQQLYTPKQANYPRLKTDVLFADYQNAYCYTGFLSDALIYITDFQLKDTALWARFVQQFRENADADGGWRGEYWGKTMRAACFVYSYSKDPELYAIMAKTIQDILDSQDDLGRISSNAVETELNGWDLWGRKYVLLGMQYFLEICTDDQFAQTIIRSMERQADYIISKIGREEDGKKPIQTASNHWEGLNSCSLLEPIVRLHTLTGNPAYLEFAQYIVDCGGITSANLIDLALENVRHPYQYPVTKAYEMMSYFEGILEFYRTTGIEKYKTAVINFANKILESDFTVIGCSGCTHELFDHSTVRQTNTNNGIQQETCVTVTLMKFMYQLTLLTGDPKYIDAFEISLYNAYLGSVNTQKVICTNIAKKFPDWIHDPLPFDSYSPLTAGRRGMAIGGIRRMSDNHLYGCCACIGAAGIGLVPKVHLLTTRQGLAMNLYIDGAVQSQTPSGQKIVLTTSTKYPADGTVEISLKLDRPEDFSLQLRNPAWSENTRVTVNGEEIAAEAGYITINRTWTAGDSISITLDMRTRALYPVENDHPVYPDQILTKEDPLASKHIALQRGPVMLAQENRLGYSVDDPITVKVEADGTVNVKTTQESLPYNYIVAAKVPLADGSEMTVTDYASAGNLWSNESKMAVWMLTE